MNTIQDALVALSDRDQDYASLENNMGYAARDTGFGNSLASQVRKGRKLSFKQEAAAYRMLRTYRVQLARYGIDYDAIPKPVAPEAKPSTLKAIVELTPATGSFRIEGEGNREEFFQLLSWVKAMPQRRYEPTAPGKPWWFVLDPTSAEMVLNPVPGVEVRGKEHAEAVLRAAGKQQDASQALDADVEVPGLLGELLPFQRAAVAFARENPAVFVGDTVGLGKTVEAIAIAHDKDAYPLVVVCPSTMKIAWQRHFKSWVGKDAVILKGRKPYATEGEVFIINYDVLSWWVPALAEKGPKGIVFDESHYLKNGKAKRSKSARMLSERVPNRILLTGTPVLNRPVELASQLRVLGLLGRFGGWTRFVNRYCNPHMTPWGMDYTGSSNLQELHAKLRQNGYIRRTKEQVIEELPEKRRATVPMELTDPERYRETVRSLRRWIREKVEAEYPDGMELAVRQEVARRLERAARAEAMTKINALKQVAAEEKLDNVVSWVTDFLEDSDEKIILFAHHKHIIARLAEEFTADTITGDDSPTKKQAAVDRFQEDPDARVLVIGIMAGGVGLTLTAASNVAFIELPWRPGDLEQAEGRAYARMNDLHGLTAWYLLAAGTIDEMVAGMLHDKQGVVDAVTDGKETDPETSLLRSLLAHFLEDDDE